MELRDFFEDDDMTTFKMEYQGKRRHEFSRWIGEQCRDHEMYYSGEFTKDGGIDFNYVSTDEELWAKWRALESGKRVFFLAGENRRLLDLRRAKLRAEMPT